MGMGHRHVSLTVGSRALRAFEPRQVRKEAALRTPSQVPRFRPARAGDAVSSGEARFDDGARDRADNRQDDTFQAGSLADLLSSSSSHSFTSSPPPNPVSE